jgi:hypothetical protein
VPAAADDTRSDPFLPASVRRKVVPPLPIQQPLKQPVAETSYPEAAYGFLPDNGSAGTDKELGLG